jgi:hypothetical protein
MAIRHSRSDGFYPLFHCLLAHSLPTESVKDRSRKEGKIGGESRLENDSTRRDCGHNREAGRRSEQQSIMKENGS